MRDLVKYGAILTIICIVSGVSLAFVYSKTSVIIADRQAKEAMKAMAVVLPAATDFVEIPADELSQRRERLQEFCRHTSESRG